MQPIFKLFEKLDSIVTLIDALRASWRIILNLSISSLRTEHIEVNI